MKTIQLIIFSALFPLLGYAQPVGPPNDCGEAIPTCDTSTFNLTSNNSTDDVVDVTSGSFSNPSTNPNPAPGNAGCLLSGETSSTFMILTATTGGQLEWSIGFDGNSGCYDWIMWEYSQGVCADIHNNNEAPVACNWNGFCEGFTGMTDVGNLPAGADQSNFEYSLTVNAGDQFLLLLSNYSFQNQPVTFTSNVSPSSASLVCTSGSGGTICEGDSTQITASANNLINKTYSWSPTTNLVDPNVQTTDAFPNDTTTYTCTIQGEDPSGAIVTETVDVTVNVEPKPTPDAGNDTTACLSVNNHQLDGTISDPVNNYHWEYIGPSGTPAPPNVIYTPGNNDPTPNIAVNYAGTYQMILVEENTNCISRDTVEVTFEDPSHTVTVTDPLCNGGNMGSIEIDNPEGDEYSIDNGSTFQSSSIFNNLSAGTYDVISVTAAGCEYSSQETLTDPVPTTVSVSNDTTVCENGTATVSATAGGNANNPDFIWDFTTSINPTQNVSPVSDSTVSVYVETADGCLSDTDSVDIDVLPPIQLTPMQDKDICPYEGETYFETQASGGNGGPYDFQWNDNLGGVYNNTDSIRISSSQSTQVCVTVEDGCESSAQNICAQLSIFNMPSIQMNSDKTSGCNPLAVSFQNLTTPSYASTKWSFGDGNTQTENSGSISHTYNSAGIYDVTMFVVTADGCKDTLVYKDYIEVYKTPDANFQLLPNPTTTSNTTIDVLNQSSNDVVDYQWDFGAEAEPSSSTQEDVEVTFPDDKAANYPVQLIVENADGCSDSTDQLLSIKSDVVIYAPNAFTPDGDQHNQFWRVYMDGIDIYNFNLIVYNRWGEPVWESNNPEAEWDGTYKASGKKAPNGTYVWIINVKDASNDKKHEFKGHVSILR